MEPSRIVEAIQGVVLQPSASGALWLAAVSFVGELIAPFPSSLVFAGQLLFLHDGLSLGLIAKLVLLVSMPMAIGTTLGSYLTYGIAYAGGKPAIEKFKSYLRFSWSDVERLESRFSNKWYDEFLFLALRCVPLLPTVPINILAGTLRMNFWKYTIFTFAGTLIRLSIVLILFGAGGEGLG